MGRKKKKVEKPWCWYCNREFDDEKILIQHQKAKHFKCHLCNKKLFTGPGLSIHCMQVHKETIDKIPGAVPGRDNIDVEVYGMEGIPQEYDGGAEPKAKKPAIAVPTTSTPIVTAPFPAPGFPMMPPMGAVPTPYVTGQFFGARPQFAPGLPAASMIKPTLPPTFPPQFIPQSTSALAAAASINAANIPMPSVIPTPPMPQVPATFPAYQQATIGAPSGDVLSAQRVASVQVPPVLSGSKSLGSKTRIVVPDENVSLEELMANRLELLSQVRHHY